MLWVENQNSITKNENLQSSKFNIQRFYFFARDSYIPQLIFDHLITENFAEEEKKKKLAAE